jgi:hypothetical protein
MTSRKGLQPIPFFQELSRQSLINIPVSQTPLSERILELDKAYHCRHVGNLSLIGEVPKSTSDVHARMYAQNTYTYC